MDFQDIIIKKRDKQKLTKEEISFFIHGVTDGSLPDYQISALLMAILLNGMDAGRNGTDDDGNGSLRRIVRSEQSARFQSG